MWTILENTYFLSYFLRPAKGRAEPKKQVIKESLNTNYLFLRRPQIVEKFRNSKELELFLSLITYTLEFDLRN